MYATSSYFYYCFAKRINLSRWIILRYVSIIFRWIILRYMYPSSLVCFFFFPFNCSKISIQFSCSHHLLSHLHCLCHLKFHTNYFIKFDQLDELRVNSFHEIWKKKKLKS